MSKTGTFFLAGLCLLSVPTVAKANGQNLQTYEAEFFESNGPSTALDIAREVPGFTLDLGPREERRGFADNAGNVVLNGQRPATKSETLEAILSRIPAQRVVRVEVSAGARFGADYVGKAQVLNIVLASERGVSGTLKAQATRQFTGDIIPDGAAAISYEDGAWSFSGAIASGRVGIREEGYDAIYALPIEELQEYRAKANIIHDRTPNFAFTIARDGSGFAPFKFHVRYQPKSYFLQQDTNATTSTGEARADLLIQNIDTNMLELGGDLRLGLAGGDLTLLGLGTWTATDQNDSLVFGINDPIDGFEQAVDSDGHETIGRATWEREGILGFDVEISIEAAYNRLTSDVQVFDIAPGGERVKLSLPVDNALVEEWRSLASFQAGRSLTRTLRLQGGWALERSKLEVAGDVSADRNLSYFKPSASLNWQKNHWRAQISARRTVAQLDFADFIAGAELANDRVNAGNATLVPQSAIELRAVFSRTILESGMAKLELGIDAIDDLQDRILTPDGFDAPGNIGSGKLRFATLTLDAPLERLGVKGARLKAVGILRQTRVTDPVTGENRRFTGIFPKHEWRVEYRHDKGDLSWGATVSKFSDAIFYRINEVDRYFPDGPRSSAFVEYRLDPKTTLRLDADNPLDQGGRRTRLFSNPNRLSDPSRIEKRYRNRHAAMTVSLTKTL